MALNHPSRMNKAEATQMSRREQYVEVSAVDHSDYQNARRLARGGDGNGHYAKEALRLHMQLFYSRNVVVLDRRRSQAERTKSVVHPLLRGMQ